MEKTVLSRRDLDETLINRPHSVDEIVRAFGVREPRLQVGHVLAIRQLHTEAHPGRD